MSLAALKSRAKEVIKKRDKEGATVDTDQAIRPIGRPGSRVRISHGEEIDMEATTTISRLNGQVARIDGAPYVAPKGPNAGKLIQPVRTDAGAVLGVPTDRLTSDTGSCGHSRPSVGGGSRRYSSNYEKIFGHA